jgi:5'-deoxynucleotidase YfbR-like HD superfamily hydrolase
MKTKAKDDGNYEYLFSVKKDLLRFLETIKALRHSFEMQRYFEQFKRIEDFLEPLLGYDQAD